MKLKTITFLVSGLLLSGTALADQSFTAQGRVIHSTPVYKTIHIERDNHRCRDNYRSHSGYSNSGHKRDQSRTKTYISAKSTKINNSLRHSKHGKHNDYNRHESDRHNHRPERCDSGRHYETKRILKGFDVTYRYKGDTFHTFTKRRPGRRITLNISIRPQY